MALDSLNSREADHKPHSQKEKSHKIIMLVSLNDGLLFCITVGSNCKPCMTVTEYNTALLVQKACIRTLQQMPINSVKRNKF